MAITRVQYKHQYPATSGVGYSFTSNNTAGNFIVVVVSGSYSGGAFSYSFSDSNGNTYTALSLDSAPATDVKQRMFYSPNIVSGSNQITVTYSGGVSDVGFTAVEYSGIKLTSPLDVEATPLITNDNTSTLVSNSFNPQSGSLIFAAFASEIGVPGGIAPVTGTGITIFQTDNGHYDSQGENLSATSGSQTVTFNLTNAILGSGAVNVAAFLPETTQTNSGFLAFM